MDLIYFLSAGQEAAARGSRPPEAILSRSVSLSSVGVVPLEQPTSLSVGRFFSLFGSGSFRTKRTHARPTKKMDSRVRVATPPQRQDSPNSLPKPRVRRRRRLLLVNSCVLVAQE